MDKEKIKMLNAEILSLFFQNIEQNYFIFKLFLEASIKSTINFGLTSATTKDTIDIFKEYIAIQNEEKILTNFLKKNINKIDYIETQKLLDLLDKKNDDTVLYYVKLLENISTSSELKDSFRAKRYKKDFTTLLDTQIYRIKAYSLILDADDIKFFLNYPEDFWKVIDPKIIYIDSHTLSHFNTYKTIYDKDPEEIRLPKIINYDTALINIRILSDIYKLYNNYNQNSYEELEYDFTNKFLIKKIYN